jgi:hypothetical protein
MPLHGYWNVWNFKATDINTASGAFSFLAGQNAKFCSHLGGFSVPYKTK